MNLGMVMELFTLLFGRQLQPTTFMVCVCLYGFSFTTRKSGILIKKYSCLILIINFQIRPSSSTENYYVLEEPNMLFVYRLPYLRFVSCLCTKCGGSPCLTNLYFSWTNVYYRIMLKRKKGIGTLSDTSDL